MNKSENAFRPNTSIFSSLFLNIDGNRTNFDNFLIELDRFDFKFSAIGLAETNIDAYNKDLYQIDDYNSCYQAKNCNKNKGSGVGIYVHKQFNFVENAKLTHFSSNLETVFVDITNTSEPLTIGTIYRPPSGDRAEFV